MRSTRLYRSHTEQRGGSVSVEDIRASSGEGLPICIDKDRIFSSDPLVANNSVYVAYEGKRYYAANPTELAENIETLISGGTLAVKPPVLPRADTAASAVLGAEMDAADAVDTVTPPAKPKGLGDAMKGLYKSATPLFDSVGKSISSAKRTNMAPRESKGLVTAMKGMYKSTGEAVAPIGQRLSSYWTRTRPAATTESDEPAGPSYMNRMKGMFTRKKTEASEPANSAATPVANAETAPAAGPSYMNRMKGMFTRKNKEPRPGSVAAEMASATPVVPTVTKPSIFKRMANTTRRAATSAASAASGAISSARGAFSRPATAPRPTVTRSGSVAAAPTGGSRHKRKSKRSGLAATTRRAYRQVKTHK